MFGVLGLGFWALGFEFGVKGFGVWPPRTGTCGVEFLEVLVCVL